MACWSQQPLNSCPEQVPATPLTALHELLREDTSARFGHTELPYLYDLTWDGDR